MLMARVLLALLLAGCAAPGSQAQIPGGVDCKGKSTLAMVGGVNAFSGVNGSLSFDCGDGAFIHWGPAPTAP